MQFYVPVYTINCISIDKLKNKRKITQNTKITGKLMLVKTKQYTRNTAPIYKLQFTICTYTDCSQLPSMNRNYSTIKGVILRSWNQLQSFTIQIIVAPVSME